MVALVKGISPVECYKCENNFYVTVYIELDARRNCTLNDENHSFIVTKRSNGGAFYECTKCEATGYDTDERPDKRFRKHVIKKI